MAKLDHIKLIELMKVNYPAAYKGGICSGLALMFIQAALSSELKDFYFRLKAIFNLLQQHRFNMESVEEAIRELEGERMILIEDLNAKQTQFSAQEKAHEIERLEKEAFTAQQLAILNLNSFFDGAEVYLRPMFYPELFETPTFHVNDLLVSSVMLPDKLEKEGGLNIVDESCGIYSPEEITNIFKTLRETLIARQYDKPVPILLSSHNHRISLTFEPVSQNWVYFDANQIELDDESLNDHSIPKAAFISDEEIALNLFSGFSGMKPKAEDIKDQKLSFATQIFTTKSNATLLTGIIHEWKKKPELEWDNLQKVTTEKCQLRDYIKNTWFYISTINNQHTLATTLLENGSVANLSYQDGDTVLHEACFKGNVELVKALLMKDVDVNALTKDQTPLYMAASGGSLEVVNLLLAHPNFSEPPFDIKIESPLMRAVLFGHIDIVKRLYASNYRSSPSNMHLEDLAALSVAVKYGHDNIVEYLLTKNIKLTTSATVLLLAAIKSGYDKIVSLLLEQNIPLVNTPKDSLLHSAAQSGKSTIIAHLLKAGIPVDFLNDQGETVLFSCVENQQYDLVSQLLLAKANPNFICADTEATPLSIAVQAEDVKMVKLLLMAGAVPSKEIYEDVYDEFTSEELKQCFNDYKKAKSAGHLSFVSNLTTDHEEHAASSTNEPPAPKS